MVRPLPRFRWLRPRPLILIPCISVLLPRCLLTTTLKRRVGLRLRLLLAPGPLSWFPALPVPSRLLSRDSGSLRSPSTLPVRLPRARVNLALTLFVGCRYTLSVQVLPLRTVVVFSSLTMLCACLRSSACCPLTGLNRLRVFTMRVRYVWAPWSLCFLPRWGASTLSRPRVSLSPFTVRSFKTGPLLWVLMVR